MEKWNRSWGYSGIVGEWSLTIPGENSYKPDERFQKLIDILETLLPLVQKFHR